MLPAVGSIGLWLAHSGVPAFRYGWDVVYELLETVIHENEYLAYGQLLSDIASHAEDSPFARRLRQIAD
ncbi:uncharacterized protein P174DRAFT_444950 [Aspergillus novofumigatus IBT 16806]|uniref:Uncharacterized protein n=1 Tax=Aspergillus novofumigatus (strain IBT 16806) TaxID=1392255 RepID=A0A2I1C0U0_ASPN1|nr:uncharacterized protein P174DRAFT_444950 [Aspergillus novofumigatus IBT 16806]PKX91254.1 hypothetical protein P174DRAFT_444950 [Aspergillus novofumigatus IBT 16806]